MTSDPVRLGVAGLGRAFVLMLPTFRADPRVRLVAAAAPRAESRDAFEQEFGGRGHTDVDALAADPEVEAIYIATPHQMHADHVTAAARHGKHILVDKPLAVSLSDADAIVAAAEVAGVHLIVGPSHSFDAPVALARSIIDSGELGAVRMVHAFNYTDFLYRPRRPEELRTEDGGGVLFSQGVHQIDIVRLLCGGEAERITAMTGAWDPARPTEGAYSALMSFRNGAFASLTYSGYAHFDSDIWMDDVAELGADKDPSGYGKARRALQGLDPAAEARLKTTRTYGATDAPAPAAHHEHFGPIIVSCDRGDLRLTPDGVELCGDFERRFIAAPMTDAPRKTVIDALVAAVRDDRAPAQTGRWGRASLEVCHAILRSAETGNAVDLTRQCGLNNEEERA
ncbi:Putative 4,5-dihydroxyphthalate dehydrogenase [Roseivivax sp. THAF40]|uniref:Gfo/Idh/MocA family protein n=1 Tax=unclassified Roseivivax TaxID=2639302 RepID=UPI0012693AD6|nr:MULTISPECIES: Gfo/Idh/MocA family oxidoreductase [unclassified Roseivivax]QFS83594.1 Putative 4,5-dihydroxyphthalate dehydrogenase [Roseivivax sp. THAF197b]QFT47340.1 Putative 4,5-dihydroxyphthalate dehydrogenase [Roseivivax sp. THAF40]